MPGTPPRVINCSGEILLNMELELGQRAPMISEAAVEKNVERFVDTDQQRDTGQFILREQAVAIFLSTRK